MNIADEYNKIKKQYEEDLARKHQEMLDENQRVEHERIRKMEEEDRHTRDSMYWNNTKEMYDEFKEKFGDEDITYAFCAFLWMAKKGSTSQQFMECLASIKRTLDKQKKHK